MVSVIEDEYEYHLNQLGKNDGKEPSVVQEYEDLQEEADVYYDELHEELNDNGDSVMCPCCCVGFLHEVEPNYCVCSHCGMDVHRNLVELRQQFSSVYQQHSCPKVLHCQLIPSKGLLFSCSSCNFSMFLD